MRPHPRILDHPFYLAWSKGDVSERTVRLYHQSYGDFVRAIPVLWRRIIDAFRPDSVMGDVVIRDELFHTVLWEKWGVRLRPRGNSQLLEGTIRAFESMPPSALLGAMHAYELQQPELASVKKEGLIRYYGFTEEELTYFDEHEKEAPHIAYGAWLGRHFADPIEFADGFIHGSQVIYHSLDVFAAT